MKKNLLILATVIIFFGCGQSSNKEESADEVVETIENSLGEESSPDIRTDKDLFLISERKVGLFKIGYPLPEKTKNKGLVFEEKKEIVFEEGEEYEDVFFIVSNESGPLLKLIPEYDFSHEKPSDIIGVIEVLSEKFKTEDGIGLNSTIFDFLDAYPWSMAWYTYVSDMYVLQVEGSGIQFIVENDAYAGEDLVIDGDMMMLDVLDFKTSSRIKKIKVF